VYSISFYIVLTKLNSFLSFFPYYLLGIENEQMDTNASSLIGFEDKLLSQQPKQTNVYFQQPQYLPVSSMDQLAGLYSNTGFDMVHILSRLMHR
jgi:hypothetical protein